MNIDPSKIIYRRVSSPERMLEIIKSMPCPIVQTFPDEPQEDQPSTFICVAQNYNGVCEYTLHTFNTKNQYNEYWLQTFQTIKKLY